MSTSQECPLVTILINNYNYARFLPQAIDSALRQTWKATEVVVVDDGSTDHSAEVIRRYGNSVLPVLQANGGQAAALNAGFAASHGEILCFLDADDVFSAHKLAYIARAWQSHGRPGLLYHQLHFINGAGQRIGRRWPSSMLAGELSTVVAHSGGWWPVPTTSALCVSREFLRRISPIPVQPFRLCADAYIAGLAPFLTSITGIRRPLASYRIHGENCFNRGIGTRENYLRRAARYETEFHEVQRALAGLLDAPPALSLDDHYPYQLHRWLARQPVSFARVLKTLWRTESVTFPMKLRSVKDALRPRPAA
jgi:hypothetical protein